MQGGEDDEEAGGQLEAPLLLPEGALDDEEEDEGSSPRAPATETGAECAWRNRALIAVFALVDFTSNLAVSVVFPFLPMSLEEAGAGPYQRGIVFAALPFGVLIVSPLVPPLLWRVGPVPILTGSLALLAACLVACAFWAGPSDVHDNGCSSPAATTSGGGEVYTTTTGRAGTRARRGRVYTTGRQQCTRWTTS